MDFSVCWLSLIMLIIGRTSSNEEINIKKNGNALEKFFLNAMPEDYNHDDGPTKAVINVSVILLGVPSVRFSRMEIELEFFFSAAWQDERLVFDETVKDLAKVRRGMKIPKTVSKRLWIPWIFFPECKECGSGFAIGADQQLLFTPGNRAMGILYRVTMLFNCHFDLTFYPFDAHECSIALQLVDGSIANRSMLLANVASSSFPYPPEHFVSDGMPSEFQLQSLYVKHECSKRTFGPARSVRHCLKYGIRFHRIAAYYLMLVYTPSLTIVLISWTSFWLSVDAPAPRVALGLTSLLTLTTQFSSAQKNLPPVAYIKALDVWMIMCVFMVFGSLLEFTLAHHQNLERKIVKPTTVVSHTQSHVNCPKGCKNEWIPKNHKLNREVNWWDAKARIVFPLAFGLFNIIYWPFYGRGG